MGGGRKKKEVGEVFTSVLTFRGEEALFLAVDLHWMLGPSLTATTGLADTFIDRRRHDDSCCLITELGELPGGHAPGEIRLEYLVRLCVCQVHRTREILSFIYI